MNPSESRRSDLFHNRWLHVAGGIVLAIAGWVMTSPLRSAMDIFFLDETGYLVRGMNMFPKIPRLWGPVYCFWYKVLSVFESDPVNLFYLNFGLVSVLLAIAVYLFLLRFRAAWPVAFWMGFMVLIASINLPTFPKVSHFAAIAGMTGLMIAYSLNHSQNRYVLITMLFLMLSYIRPEFYLAFFICALAVTIGWVTRSIKLQWTPILIISIIAGILLHITLGMPLGIELRGYKRSFIAFGEHFSWNYSSWNDLEGYVWLTWESVVASEFGDSRRIAEAMRANPHMFFRHIFYNLGIYVNELCRTVTSILLPMQAQPSILRFTGPVIAGALLLVPRLRRDFTDRLKHHRALLVFLSLFALPSVVSCLVVFPREHYIIIQLPLIVWLLAELLSTIFRRIASNRSRQVTSAVLGLLVLGYFVFPRTARDFSYFDMRKTDSVFNNLSMLDHLDRNAGVLEGSVLLSHEGDFSRFTEAGIQFENALAKKERPFDEFLQEVDPDLIYFTQTIFNNPDYMTDPAWALFIEKYRQGGDAWKYLSVNGGDREFILVRPELFDQLDIRGPN
jgi:hypothetical protein